MLTSHMLGDLSGLGPLLSLTGPETVQYATDDNRSCLRSDFLARDAFVRYDVRMSVHLGRACIVITRCSLVYDWLV